MISFMFWPLYCPELDSAGPLEQEGEWVPGPVRTFWEKEEIPCLCQDLNVSLSRIYPSHY
jgi:hypothetical protein